MEHTLKDLYKRVGGIEARVDRLYTVKKSHNDIKDQLATMRRKNAEVYDAISKVDERSGEVKARLKLFDPTTVEKQFLEMKDRMYSMSKIFEANLLRMRVLTEVSYAIDRKAPKFAAGIQNKIIELFNKPDEWWIERRNMKTSEWFDYIITGEENAKVSV